MLVLLGIIGVGSIGILLVVDNFLPQLTERAQKVAANLATTADAARTAFARNGVFPNNLANLATASGLPATGAWRLDPYGAVQDLDYRRTATGVRIRSRGLDLRFNTADDVVVDVPAEDQLRVRQRARLRLLRALLAGSPHRHAVSMSPSEVDAMRSAMRTIALGKRAFRDADPIEQAALTVAMTAAQDDIADLRFLHGLPAMPTTLTGAGGLMEAIGRPDNLAVDGAGRALVFDASLGVVAVGWDRTGGTDDDM